jgi:hypothetical protein
MDGGRKRCGARTMSGELVGDAERSGGGVSSFSELDQDSVGGAPRRRRLGAEELLLKVVALPPVESHDVWFRVDPQRVPATSTSRQECDPEAVRDMSLRVRSRPAGHITHGTRPSDNLCRDVSGQSDNHPSQGVPETSLARSTTSEGES